MGKNAPDPTPASEIVAAQSGSNISNATANAYLQNVNEVGPDGTRTFEQIGTQSVYDPNLDQNIDIPQFQVTTTLSDAQRRIKDQNDAAGLNLATLGNDLSGQLGDQLTGNFSLGNEATEARLFELGRARLDPRFAESRESLRTQLANQGIHEGSAAYDRALSRHGEQENDAYNQLLLSGRGQAAQELLAEDNQRINQISALLSGGQVSQPNFQSGVGVSGIAPVNVAGAIQNEDAQNAANYYANQQLLGSTLGAAGGLFSLFG